MSGNIIKLDQELIHTELKDLVKNVIFQTNFQSVVEVSPRNWTLLWKDFPVEITLDKYSTYLYTDSRIT